MPTTTDRLPAHLRAYAVTAADLAATTSADLRDTRDDLTAAIARGATGDTLLLHRHNLAAVNNELAQRTRYYVTGRDNHWHVVDDAWSTKIAGVESRQAAEHIATEMNIKDTGAKS